MECSDSLDDVDERFECKCLRWSINDEMDYMQRREVKREQAVQSVGEWFRLEWFSNNEGSLGIVLGSYRIRSFSGGFSDLKTDFTLTTFAGTKVRSWTMRGSS